MSDQIAPENLPDAILDERRRIRRLRAVVDLTCAVLRQQRSLSEQDAERLIAAARRTALSLFPDSAHTFDLILAPRFERILHERGVAHG